MSLLAAGLIGEAGSILAEEKKKHRDGESYTPFQQRITEEIGDFLWYYARLVTVLDSNLLRTLASHLVHEPPMVKAGPPLATSLELGAAVGALLAGIVTKSCGDTQIRALLLNVWISLIAVSRDFEVPLELAAKENRNKVNSRWPARRVYATPFDSDYPANEQLPRYLRVFFRQIRRGRQRAVVLTHCDDESRIGETLTDNIRDPDGYRFHDVFHLAHTACLGWSPVIRALLRCKRKSDPEVDEAEDGARAATLEEAVSALVFSRAKRLRFFSGIEQLDYDLLKTVRNMVQGYEVDSVPLWQWEMAILTGYRVFRQLRANGGGEVTIDMSCHQISYANPKPVLSTVGA